MLRALLLLSVLLSGCFQAPSLPVCSPESPCQPSLPLCRDGLCFHYGLDYRTPLCEGTGASGCCDLATGTGCELATAPVPAIGAWYAGDQVTAVRPDGSWGTLAADGQWQSLGEATLSTVAGVGSMAGNGICLWGGGQLVCCADGTDSCETHEFGVEFGAPPALCPDWRVAVAGSESVMEIRDGETSSTPLDVGELPTGLGPLLHLPTDTTVVPTENGQSVTLLHAGQNAGAIPAAELPGGILGMALDHQYLYVAAREGRLVARQLDVPAGLGNDWQTVGAQEAWAAGPVVSTSGDVLIVTEAGDLLRINRINFESPERVEWQKGIDEIVALHGEGVAGLQSAGTKTDAATRPVLSLLPAALLPWLADEAGWVRIAVQLESCRPHTISVAETTGHAVFLCSDGDLAVGVSPAPAGRESPWPARRGLGASGCYVGQ